MLMIETEDVWKNFHTMRGRKKVQVEAVRGINLQVQGGEIFGFLGPNGAGKTTMMRILATLLPADKGRAIVAGHDLRREQSKVRESIGYVGQLGGAEGMATGRENVILQGQLYGLSADTARRRASELIEDLQMNDFADRLVRTYSGGQRRRLDLALGLVHKPKLLFLDEPSIGLDPQSRAQLWDEVRKLHTGGATVFLTTHYLEEADSLCDRLAIIDEGKIVAEGTPAQLKQQIAGDIITLRLENPTVSIPLAQELLHTQPFVREIQPPANREDQPMQVYVERGEEALAVIMHLLNAAELNVQAVALARPSLDDVFLRQTGHALASAVNQANR
ncbi:MAG TPA: ATP-binding cassette domain-containing protein [Ktedonobacteraceae bacterium]|nr:ATP-binding cassette domain-containing protein [Ktedonobacteraceae bacterium]